MAKKHKRNMEGRIWREREAFGSGGEGIDRCGHFRGSESPEPVVQ